MAYTQADVDALKSAIKGGQIEVQYGDKRVRYRSLDEMVRLLKLMQADVAATAGKTRRSMIRLVSAGKGV